MNQQNQGSGTPSNVPVKRKRGRPRKEESVVRGGENVPGKHKSENVPGMHKSENVPGMDRSENVPGMHRSENVPGMHKAVNVPVMFTSENVPVMHASENVPVMHASENVLNSNQTVSTSDDCDNDMVGKPVTGVIEAAFNAGYLLNVKLADSDTCLRGVVFLPDQVNPITAENDVAPHVKMINRKEPPIPILNPQTEVHGSGSGPSWAQCSKKSIEPEIQLPMSEEQLLPTEIRPGISVSLENQSVSTSMPMADLAKNETSISRGGIPPGISESQLVNQPAPIMSEMECDKTIKQGDTLHELDASTQVKECSGDGGVTKDSGISESQHVNQPPPSMSEMECDKTVKQVDTLHKLNASAKVKECSGDGEATKDSEISESQHVNQPTPIISEMECDETVKQGDTLHELNASTQVKESSGDGEATKDSGIPESQHVNQPAPIISEMECDETDKQVDTLHELDASTQVKESSGDGEATGDSGISESQHVNQPAPIISEMECDETDKQGDTLHELNASAKVKESSGDGEATKDSEIPESQHVNQPAPIIHELNASTQVKESSSDEGATKDSGPASEPINLVPTNKELRTGQQALPSVDLLNEVVHGEPSSSNIELNQIPESSEPECMPSEQTSESVENIVEEQALPEIDLLEDTKTDLAIETLSEVETSNSDIKPSTGIANIPDLGSNQALVTGHPESTPSIQVSQSDPSGSILSSEGCDFLGKSDDPRNCSSLGDVDKVDINQPAESLVDAVHSENQNGSDT